MSFGSSSSHQESHPVDMTPTAFKNLQLPFAARLAQMMGFSPEQFSNFSGGGGFNSSQLGGSATGGGTPNTDYSKYAMNYQPGGKVTDTGNGFAYESMPDGSSFVLRSTAPRVMAGSPMRASPSPLRVDRASAVGPPIRAAEAWTSARYFPAIC
jgi:hypothetical protein